MEENYKLLSLNVVLSKTCLCLLVQRLFAFWAWFLNSDNSSSFPTVRENVRHWESRIGLHILRGLISLLIVCSNTNQSMNLQNTNRLIDRLVEEEKRARTEEEEKEEEADIMGEEKEEEEEEKEEEDDDDDDDDDEEIGEKEEEKGGNFSKWVENAVEKGEFAHNEQFLLFLTEISKDL